MLQFVGSVLAFREEEPGTVVYHAALGILADSPEDAEHGLLEKVRVGWPESGGWHSHRAAATRLDTLIAELRAKAPDYDSRVLYIGSQYATQNRDDGLNENSVVAVAADSVRYAETLFLEGVHSRYPEADGWMVHSVNYKSINQILAEG
jgi:hypothetical protein